MADGTEDKVQVTLEVNDEGSLVIKDFEKGATQAFKKSGDSAEKATRRTSSSFEKMKGQLKGLRQHWLGLTAAAASFVYAAKSTVDAFMVQEEAENRLAKAMANAGQFTQERIEDLKAYAAGLQQITTYGDEAIMQEMALLQTFQMSEEQLKLTTQASLDLASGMGLDLRAAVLLVGKAFTGETSTLSRYGIKIREGLEETEKFDAVLGAIQERFGGAAQAEINTYAGQIKQLSNEYGDLKETLGKYLIIAIESVRYSLDMLAGGFWKTLGSITKGLKTAADYWSKLPFMKTAIDFYGLTDALEEFGRVTDVALNENLQYAEKHLKAVSILQEKNTATVYRNREAIEEESEAIGKNTKEREKLIEQLKKEEEARKDLQDTMINQLTGLQDLGATEGMMSELWEAIEQGDKNLYDQLYAHYEDSLEKKAKAGEEAEAQLKKRNQETARANEQMLQTMEGQWRDYFNLILAEYDSFGGMMKAIGRKLLFDIANNIFSVGRTLSSGTAAAAGIPGMGGDLSTNLLSTISDKLGFMNKLWGKAVGPGGLLIDTHALPEGVAGPTLPPELAGLGTILGLAGGGYGLYSAYKSGSPLTGGLSGAAFGAGAFGAANWMGAGMAGGMLGTAGLAFMGVGALVGVGLAMAGKKKQEALERRIERAKEYFKELEEISKKQYDSLADLMADVNKTISSKHVYAAIKYGKLSAPGIEELYVVANTLGDYKEAVEGFGQSSLMAIDRYRNMGREMERFGATSAAWTGQAKEVADAWLQNWEKMKKLQIKAIMEDLEEGTTLFASAMKKLEFLDLSKEQEATLKYQASLSFLTTDTLPALSGELTLARDILKETREEVKRMGDAEAELDIKTRILLSDLELTEGQLRAIKEGHVNLDMIKIAQAFGVTDEEIILVNADLGETVSLFESLESAAESMQDTLEGLRRYFEGIAIPDELQKTYEILYMMSMGLDLIAVAGQKLENLTESAEEYREKVKAGEATLQDYNQMLLEVADTALYVGSALEQVASALDYLGAAEGMYNLVKGAARLVTQLGTVVMVLQMIVEFTLLAQRGLQHFMQTLTENEQMADKVNAWIDRIEDRFPELAEHWREVWFKGLEDVPGRLKDIFEETFWEKIQQAGSLYQRYEEELGYTSKTDVGRQAEDIRRARDEAIATIEEAIAEKGLTEELGREWIRTIEEGARLELEALKDDLATEIGDALAVIDLTPLGKQMWELNKAYEEQKQKLIELEMPLDDLNKLYVNQREALLENFMKPIEEIIATAGMTDAETQIYRLNRQYDEWKMSLKEMAGLDPDNMAKYVDAMGDLERARRIEIEAIEEQQRKAREAFLKPFEDIVAKSGMSQLDAALYDLTRRYEDNAERARELGVSLNTLTEAYREQARSIIEDFWDPIIENIERQMNSLSFSQFNLAPGAEKAESAQGRYEELKERLLSATGEDFAGAYRDYQAFINTYLGEMRDTYKSSSVYLAAYEDVMRTLERARGIAGGERAAMLSEYESKSLGYQGEMKAVQKDQLIELVGIGATLTDMSGFSEDLLAEYDKTNLVQKGIATGIGELDSRMQKVQAVMKEGNSNTWAIRNNTRRTADLLDDIKDIVEDIKSQQRRRLWVPGRTSYSEPLS